VEVEGLEPPTQALSLLDAKDISFFVWADRNSRPGKTRMISIKRLIECFYRNRNNQQLLIFNKSLRMIIMKKNSTFDDYYQHVLNTVNLYLDDEDDQQEKVIVERTAVGAYYESGKPAGDYVEMLLSPLGYYFAPTYACALCEQEEVPFEGAICHYCQNEEDLRKEPFFEQ
jgi:hypothetical protein